MCKSYLDREYVQRNGKLEHVMPKPNCDSNGQFDGMHGERKRLSGCGSDNMCAYRHMSWTNQNNIWLKYHTDPNVPSSTSKPSSSAMTEQQQKGSKGQGLCGTEQAERRTHPNDATGKSYTLSQFMEYDSLNAKRLWEEAAGSSAFHTGKSGKLRRQDHTDMGKGCTPPPTDHTQSEQSTREAKM